MIEEYFGECVSDIFWGCYWLLLVEWLIDYFVNIDDECCIWAWLFPEEEDFGDWWFFAAHLLCSLSLRDLVLEGCEVPDRYFFLEKYCILHVDYQVLGQIAEFVPPDKRGAHFHLTSIKSLIPFRLFTEKNVVYKWSIYHHYDNGEQEFVESGTINLK